MARQLSYNDEDDAVELEESVCHIELTGREVEIVSPVEETEIEAQVKIPDVDIAVRLAGLGEGTDDEDLGN